LAAIDLLPIADEIASIAQAAGEQLSFSVDTLDLTLRSNRADLISAARTSLYPLADQAAGQGAPYAVSCLVADEALQQIAGAISAVGQWAPLEGNQDLPVAVCRVGSGRDIFYAERTGYLWMIDRRAGLLAVLAREDAPLINQHLPWLARQVMQAHLEAAGWALIHAGAVVIGDHTILVIGESGRGKTSLVTSLVAQGAAYLGNEYVFLKGGASGVRALAYPMDVAVGLGTALAMPALAPLARNPGDLAAPQHRFDLDRVSSTPEADWPGLPDKITLQVTELESYLQASPARPGGVIAGVICPDVSHETSARSLPGAILATLVVRGQAQPRDSRLGFRWLDLEIGVRKPLAAEDIADGLLRVPSAILGFHISTVTPADVLQALRLD
jgi:hypothetical protein